MFFGEKRAENAEKLLTAMRDKYPEKTELWSALVALACRRQPPQWDRAVNLLAQADKKFGDRVFLRRARGQYLLLRYGKKSASDLVKLGDGAARFSAEDRLQLCRGLAVYLWEAGDLEHAKQFANRACEAAPANLAVRLLLFELTYLSRNPSGMERMLEEIKSFQGEGALWHYGEAVRLAVLAERELENTQGTQKQAGLLGQAWIISSKPATCVPAGAASFFCRRNSTIGWARSMRPLRTTARRLMPARSMRPRFTARSSCSTLVSVTRKPMKCSAAWSSSRPCSLRN